MLSVGIIHLKIGFALAKKRWGRRRWATIFKTCHADGWGLPLLGGLLTGGGGWEVALTTPLRGILPRKISISTLGFLPTDKEA